MALKNTLTCREATRLLLEDEDHELAPAERLALQVHVKICFACERFVSQLNFMRRATRAWRKHSETDAGDSDSG
jgi:Putative zinc-finger